MRRKSSNPTGLAATTTKVKTRIIQKRRASLIFLQLRPRKTDLHLTIWNGVLSSTGYNYESTGMIGKQTICRKGGFEVTDSARHAFERRTSSTAVGTIFGPPIAKSQITRADMSAAHNVRGVLDVVPHRNVPLPSMVSEKLLGSKAA